MKKILTISFILFTSFGFSQEINPWDRQVLFGEQHLHTQDSPDAYSMGVRNTVEDAYKYAKGEPVLKNTSNVIVQKKTPYDWVAITDHAEYMGVLPQLSDPNSELMKKHSDNEIIQKILSGDPKKGDEAFASIAIGLTTNNPDPNFNDPEIIKSVWQKHKDLANQYYEPGKFTTFIAFAVQAAAMYFYAQRCYPLKYETSRLFHLSVSLLAISIVLWNLSHYTNLTGFLIKVLLVICFPLILLATNFFNHDERETFRKYRRQIQVSLGGYYVKAKFFFKIS